MKVKREDKRIIVKHEKKNSRDYVEYIFDEDVLKKELKNKSIENIKDNEYNDLIAKRKWKGMLTATFFKVGDKNGRGQK